MMYHRHIKPYFIPNSFQNHVIFNICILTVIAISFAKLCVCSNNAFDRIISSDIAKDIKIIKHK